MKVTNNLEIPPSFDIDLLNMIQLCIANAGLDSTKAGMSDIYPAITIMRLKLKTAYNLGVEQGMIEAIATLKIEMDKE